MAGGGFLDENLGPISLGGEGGKGIDGRGAALAGARSGGGSSAF